MGMSVNWGDPRLPERFWAKVQPCPMSGCWLWTGAQRAGEYGQFYLRVGNSLAHSSHRTAYLTLVGTIEPGLHLDHLCRNTLCCNPAHLEPVSVYTNVVTRGVTSWSAVNARKTHCPKGHPLVPGNLLTFRSWRECLICKRETDRAARSRHRDEWNARKRAKRARLRAAREASK